MINLIYSKQLSDKNRRGTETVKNSSALSPGLCELRTFVERENSKVQTWLERNIKESYEVKALVALMWENGLRVSEVLHISEYDILHNGRIRVKGSKGSSDRFVVPVRYRNVWFKRELRMPVFLRNIDRWFVYRVCRRYGFYYEQLGKGNSKVTHYFRYLYMLSMKLDNLTEKERAELVGHKNLKSQLYYYDKNLKQV
jgi:integrase